MEEKRLIKVYYTTVDHSFTQRNFHELEEAQKWAQHWIGEAPTLGGGYAISDDGVGKIECEGCTLRELFPKGF